MLTATQKQTLKTDIAANANTVLWQGSQVAISALPNSADANFAIAAWYNLLAVPDYWVWYVAPAEDVFNAVVWKNFTPADAVPVTDTGNQYMNRALACQGKQFNLQTLLVGRISIDGRKSSIRTGFKDSLQDVPAGAAGAPLDAGWTGVRDSLSRRARNIEKLLITGGAGTKAAAGDMGYEGTITGDDVEAARNS